MLVTATDVGARLGREFTGAQLVQVDTLLADAEEIIGGEFARVGRDLDTELAQVLWLPGVVRRVIRDMVSAAVLVGGAAGRRSVSSTTGPVADAETYTDDALGAVGFGGVRLTDEQREDLGLPVLGLPSVSAPEPHMWPEVSADAGVHHGRRW